MAPTCFTSLKPPTVAEANALAEGMSLAGWQLEAPRFHVTDWKVDQRFSAKDDPDRTSLPWKAPSFVYTKSPIAQREKTRVEEVPLDHLAEMWRGTSLARVVRGVLDEEDCAELVACVNQKGFTPALINMGMGWQMVAPDDRDGHRVIVDSPELTAWMFEVLKPYLPETLGDSKLVDLNERCRFLCYTPGQYFAPHRDGRYIRNAEHPHAGDFSRVTVQLYLHDVSSQAGGATNFLTRNDQPAVRCQPVVGSVLLFTQDLYHEGELLTEGLKYTLRTEAMYRKECSVKPDASLPTFKDSTSHGSSDTEDESC